MSFKNKITLLNLTHDLISLIIYIDNIETYYLLLTIQTCSIEI